MMHSAARQPLTPFIDNGVAYTPTAQNDHNHASEDISASFYAESCPLQGSLFSSWSSDWAQDYDQFDDGSCDYYSEGKMAADYELAGRRSTAHTFKDFRSAKRARDRDRARREKYFGFRAVKPGQVGAPHYTPSHRFGLWYDTLLSDAEITNMSKEQLYREAQEYPRPPKYHRKRGREYARRPCKLEKQRCERKHACQQMTEDVDDSVCRDFLSLVTGIRPENLAWHWIHGYGAGGLPDEDFWCEEEIYDENGERVNGH